MTASRLVALTLGELRRTSETSDLDTPARAATVSRVGFRAVRPGVTTGPPRPDDWSAPTLWVHGTGVNGTRLLSRWFPPAEPLVPDAMKPGIQCVRTHWIRG